MLEKNIFWILAFLLCARSGFATTGVALYEKAFVVVAADGRVNEISPIQALHTNECKIDVVNGRAAVMAGLTDERDVGFDARRMLREAMQEARSVDLAAEIAVTQIRRRLPEALADFEKHNPAAFQARSGAALQFLIVGLSAAGEVEVARRSVPYDESRSVQIEDATGSRNHVGIAVIGESRAIDLDLERLHKTAGWAGMGNATDMEKMARRFVALEIVDQPRRVGPPVSIMLVDGQGIHWLENGACHE